MKLLGPIALLLVVVGALNWGLVGLMGLDVVAKIFGDMTSITKVVYIVVGLAGVYVAVTMLPKQMAR